MRVIDIIKLAMAVLISAAVLSATVLWNEMPGSVVDDCPSGEPPANSDDAVGPYTIHHCFRVVPLAERLTKLLIALSAVVGLAYVFASRVRRAKVAVGAGACVASAVIALLVLSYVYGRVFQKWLIPDFLPFVIVCGIAGGIGAVASWVVSRRWPNTSFERTREG